MHQNCDKVASKLHLFSYRSCLFVLKRRPYRPPVSYIFSSNSAILVALAAYLSHLLKMPKLSSVLISSTILGNDSFVAAEAFFLCIHLILPQAVLPNKCEFPAESPDCAVTRLAWLDMKCSTY